MRKSTLSLGVLMLAGTLGAMADHTSYGPFETSFAAYSEDAPAYYCIIGDRATDGKDFNIDDPRLSIADNEKRQVTYGQDTRLQYWQFVAVGDGSYYVQNAVTGEYWNAGTAPNKKQGYGVCVVEDQASAQPYFIIDLANNTLGGSFEAGSFGFSSKAFDSLSATDNAFVDASTYGDYNDYNDYTLKNYTICFNEWRPWNGGNSDNGSVFYFTSVDEATVKAAYNDYNGIVDPVDPGVDPVDPGTDPVDPGIDPATLPSFIPAVTPGAGLVEALSLISISAPADEQYANAALNGETFSSTITLTREAVEEPLYEWGIDEMTAAETYEGDNVSWQLAVEITAPGTYTLTIPAAIIVAYDDSYTNAVAANSDMTVTWIIEEESSISQVKAPGAASAVTYDLKGRRASAGTRGIVIGTDGVKTLR